MKPGSRDPGPNWVAAPPPEDSWRALCKWGAPDRSRHPNPRLCRRLQAFFGMDDEAFRVPVRPGLEPVTVAGGPELAPGLRAELEAALGPENVRTEARARVAAASGKGMLDLLRLRRGSPNGCRRRACTPATGPTWSGSWPSAPARGCP